MSEEQRKLKELLTHLNFEKTSETLYSYSFDDKTQITVDFKEERIDYPDAMRVNERQTCNFSQSENFVVLECVYSLLKKGYHPSSIELEKRWCLGHGQKSGRADICVYDAEGSSMLLIIECKTFGTEYEKAKVQLKADGGQLFSYWQQEKSTKWLALYASRIIDTEEKKGKLERQILCIASHDSTDMISKKGKDESIMLYDKAGNASDLFAVWCNTYKQAISDDVIFCEDSSPYEIGVKPLTKKDLVPLSHDNKIINEFEEILRHNNVSDKENAFNRLIALFICKLVDEVTKGENDALEFQWQSGKDDYEKLQDRLQRLHRDGMKNFMGEEIFYVTNEYPERLFETYTGAKREEAIADLRSTIKKLKFYSNNDFAFKDVHNEELFLQNSKIVVEVVLLFQRYKIIYNETNQLLGDLFEKLLNKGFKQNEGQFFTPLPITRFIWDALPIKKIMQSSKLPTVIDYACGAGHFLIEAVEAINYYRQDKNTSWARDCIFGIEKDYRLARVAKISLFMHGAGDANIIFGEGLDSHPEKQIQDKKFSILVANPPYSVQGFKPHLKLKNKNAFSVLPKISDEGGEIECLFVERIAQALEAGGVAAVILPSSILSNNSNSYVAARENILQHFMIRAIVSLGSGTFSETGTNTVTLFLQKYDEMPKMTSLCEDCVSSIFASCGNEEQFHNWKDRKIYQAFLRVIGLEACDYERFLKEEYSYDELCGKDAHLSYFRQYSEIIFASSAIKNMEKKKAFVELDEEGQKKEKLKHFYREVKALEREKLVTFALLFGHKTLLVRSPESTEGQKEFLGYGWSKRKGDEGIKITKVGGLLYDEKNREAAGTIAALVREAFEGKEGEGSDGGVSDRLQEYAHFVESTSLIDFSLCSLSFAKSIRTVIKERQEIKSRWDMVRLGDVAEIKKGQSITKKETQEGNIKVVAGGKDFAYYHNKANTEANVITISASGAAGFVNFWSEPIFASDCTTIRAKSLIHTKYIYYFLKNIQDEIYKLQRGALQPHVYPTDIANIDIPNAPAQIQSQLVEECEAVDAEYEMSRMKIEEYRAKIDKVFEALDEKAEHGDIFRLSDASIFDISIGKRVISSEMNPHYNIPVYSANVFEPFGMIDKLLIEDFSYPSILWGIDGDWQVNILDAQIPFYPTDHCGILRIKTGDILPRYLAWLLAQEGKKVGFSRSYRASIERIQSLSFRVAKPEYQHVAIKEIESYETEIAHHKNIMKVASAKKKEIVKRYL